MGVSDAFGQVGINTTEPKEMLDIQGSLQIRRDIKVGIESSDNGNAGVAGQYLMSQGENLPPKWVSFPGAKIRLSESFLLSGNVSGASDSIKVSNPFTDNGTSQTNVDESKFRVLNLDESITNSGWKELKAYTTNVNIEKENSMITYNFQTQTQSTTGTPYVMYAVSVGIFLDGKLKSVRTIHHNGLGRYTYKLLNLMDVLTGVNPKLDGTKYKLQLAVRVRYFKAIENGKLFMSDPTIILIGRTMDKFVNNTTDFMNRSSLVVNIYEPVNNDTAN